MSSINPANPAGARVAEPYRIGVMDDLPDACGEPFIAGLRIAFDEYYENGVMDRPVELVERHYYGHPWRTGHPSVEAYLDLVDNEQVLAVAGPMTTDNCLSILPLLDEKKVASMGICGSQLYVGDYAFLLPNGGMADEPATVSAWLKSKGLRSIALVRDYPSQIGEEYAYHLRHEVRMRGQEIVMEQALSPVAPSDQVLVALKRLREAAADCLVYFGLGGLSGQLTDALKTLDWDPVRIMGTAFVGAAFSEVRCRAYDGWYGLEQFHEQNPVHLHALKLYERTFGKPKPYLDSVFTCGYDMGRAYSIGIGRMRIATGTALRDALETVTRLPAATGAPGTVISFSRRDHRGFKGADYLFVRKSEGGKNIYVGTAPVEGS